MSETNQIGLHSRLDNLTGKNLQNIPGDSSAAIGIPSIPPYSRPSSRFRHCNNEVKANLSQRRQRSCKKTMPVQAYCRAPIF